jgi:MFS transporter, FHS family, glucose/mannose:H+ symporter
MNQLSARGTMAASCMIFFALGVITGALGLALPDLAANASSSLATIGAIFTALFLGGFIMQLIAGSLNDRLGQRPVLLLGIGLLAAGICGIAASHALALTLACALVAGLGHGAVAVSTSVLIAQVFAARSASALNLINVFFGVGAVAGPAIAGLTLRVWGSALPALGLGAGLILLQAPFVRRLASAPSVAQLDDPAAPSGAPLRSPLLWMFGGLLLLYVGAETGIGGWTATYMQRTTTIGAASAALVTSGFWLALTGGRVAGVLIGTQVAAGVLLRMSLAGALAGTVLLALSPGNAMLTVAAVILIGFCFGPIFPTALSIVTSTFRRAPGAAVSVVVALGSLGGMLLPWAQGMLLESRGPSSSVLLVAAGALAMLALELGRGLLNGRRSIAPKPIADCEARSLDA